MSKRVFMAAITASLIFISLLAGLQVVKVAKANFIPPPPDLPPINIRDSGDVEPSNVSILHVGETYTFTNNIKGYSIVVQRSNIVIDGAGYTLHGLANRTAYRMNGMVLNGVANITVKNVVFEGLDIGVDFNNPSGNAPSYNNLITQNVFLECTYGGEVGYQCFNNTFSKNKFTEMTYGGMIYGIYLYNSYNNSIVENDFINVHSPADSVNAFAKGSVALGCGALGIEGSSYAPYGSSYNTIARNNFENNTRTVELLGNSIGNLFYQNNFINSSVTLMLPYPPPFNSNSWDNGSQGNYWSDYNGTDANLDGIGDIPYVLDGNNTDNYPLMLPINFSTALLNPTPSPTTTSTSTLSPSASITPSPSIPEFSLWIALPIFMIAMLLAAIGFKRTRRISNQ